MNSISRFVKTISQPLDKRESNFSKWQEGARKCVKRAFGALQCKFHILSKPCEKYTVD